MNQEMLIRFMENLSIEELFFRICSKKQYTVDQIRSVLKTLPSRSEFPDGTPVPESMRNLPLQILPEEDSCDTLGQRRVQILKHPCFMPPVTHSHDYFEALYVLSGTCSQTFLQQQLALHTGDFCLLSPSVAHNVYADGDSIVLLIRVSRATIESLYSSVIHHQNKDSVTDFFRGALYQKDYASYLIFRTAEDEEIRRQILDMFMEEFQAEEYADYMLTNMLIILFIKVIRKYKKTAESPSFISPSYTEAAYIYQYIQNNYAIASLNTLAKQLNYSVPYCSKYVRQCTGRSFSDLLKHIRFQIAADYLLNSDMTVERISERIGYANPENFMRMFKKTYGVSPTQYRAACDKSHKPSAADPPSPKNSPLTVCGNQF